MLVRVRRQVQEVPRPLSGPIGIVAWILGRLVRLVVVAGVAGAALTGYATYRIWDQAQRDDRPSSDAIVVMGAAQYDGRPSPIFAARLDHAIGLFQEGVAPVLVVTGGKADGDRTTEAASARAYSVARGVPEDAILAEDQSRNTLSSIRGVAALMRSAGLERAVFVSDPSHMLRVLRMAQDEGIVAHGSPTRTSPMERDALAVADAVVHELGALVVYLTGGRGP